MCGKRRIDHPQFDHPLDQTQLQTHTVNKQHTNRLRRTCCDATSPSSAHVSCVHANTINCTHDVILTYTPHVDKTHKAHQQSTITEQKGKDRPWSPSPGMMPSAVSTSAPISIWPMCDKPSIIPGITCVLFCFELFVGLLFVHTRTQTNRHTVPVVAPFKSYV